MPTYQYECGGCKYSFEAYQSITDQKLRKCSKCGKYKLHRLIGTGAGIIFKGTGFYATDYKKKDSKGSSLSSLPSGKEAKKAKSSSKVPCQPGCGCAANG